MAIKPCFQMFQHRILTITFVCLISSKHVVVGLLHLNLVYSAAPTDWAIGEESSNFVCEGVNLLHSNLVENARFYLSHCYGQVKKKSFDNSSEQRLKTYYKRQHMLCNYLSVPVDDCQQRLITVCLAVYQRNGHTSGLGILKKNQAVSYWESSK